VASVAHYVPSATICLGQAFDDEEIPRPLAGPTLRVRLCPLGPNRLNDPCRRVRPRAGSTASASAFSCAVRFVLSVTLSGVRRFGSYHRCPPGDGVASMRCAGRRTWIGPTGVTS
jgi:hypothetical protein